MMNDENRAYLLGTSLLRWENAVLKRKLRQAWLAIAALSLTAIGACLVALEVAICH